MSFTYSYEVDGANKTVSHEELFAAYNLAFAHLNGDINTPVSITEGGHTSVIDLQVILAAWRQEPELQMAALAERYAVQVEALETQNGEAMKKLSDAFRRDMLVLVAEVVDARTNTDSKLHTPTIIGRCFQKRFMRQESLYKRVFDIRH